MAARKELPRYAQALLSGAAVAVFVGLLQLTGLLSLWELRARDLRTQWTLRPERKESDPFVRPDLFMINVTNESLRLMDETQSQKWPWDRETQSYMVAACTHGKASVILYDFTLDEVGNTEDEKMMVKAVQTGPPVYFAGRFLQTRESIAKERPDQETLLKKFAIEVENDGSVSVPERYDYVMFPTPNLCKAASGVCDVSTPRDPDGILRRYRLFSRYKGRYYPSFALAALMVREKASKIVVRDRQLMVGSATVALEPDGSVLLRYYPPGKSFAWKAAWNVINGMADLAAGEKSRFDFSQLEGRVVIVGTSAAGLTDLRVTPVTPVMPGPEIHLTALSNVLSGDFLRETPGWVSVLFFSLAALGISLATRFTSAAVGGGIAAATMAAAVGLSVALYNARWIVDLVPQLLAIGLAFAATSAVNFLHEGRQRQRIKRDFQHYVSPKVVEKILKNPDALSLKGERKMLTMFFMDFAGFTSMSELLDPLELVDLISEYHNEAAEEIFKTEGTIDKYMGDAIMAFWNDPIDQADHALRACLTAVSAQKRLRIMAVKMKERGLPEMRARIGINTGIATVGNMGAKNQVGYTVIGDEVNLASRLEGVNKEFGTEIIVSEATCLPARDRLDVRDLALIKVKGKKVPVRIFELIGLKGEAPPERLEKVKRFEEAFADFRARRFNKAWETFLSLSQKGDRASEVYVGLCERFMSEPPPADWDGSYQMEHK
jgi:adenylate cyclase